MGVMFLLEMLVFLLPLHLAFSADNRPSLWQIVVGDGVSLPIGMASKINLSIILAFM
jgi:hypothetical protein